MTELGRLLGRIDLASSAREIGEIVMSFTTEAPGVSHPGLTFFDRKGAILEAYLRVPNRFAYEYGEIARWSDPIAAAAVQDHAPCVTSIDQLVERMPPELPFAEFIARHRPQGSKQYGVAPVLVGGEVTGVVQLVSYGGFRAAASALAALSLHASTRTSVLAALDARGPVTHPALTRREHEVATIAARGHTVAATAKALGVSPNTVKKALGRIYSKLRIRSRAELGARLLSSA